jgi:hypothetical protein
LAGEHTHAAPRPRGPWSASRIFFISGERDRPRPGDVDARNKKTESAERSGKLRDGAVFPGPQFD